MTFTRRAFHRWLSRWLPGGAPQPLSIWGKLPTHADYLHHKACAEIARDWQAWLSRFSPPPQRSRIAGWTRLEPAPPDPRSVPVGFVLPPGTLAFAGPRYVAGVMAGSFDSVGRAHPLLVWRCVDAQWLDAQAVPGLPWWHAQAQLLERLSLLASALEEEGQHAELAWDWSRLCDLAAQLDAAPPVDAHELQSWLVRRLPPSQETPPPLMLLSHRLHGVRHMPWAQWPEGKHAAARHAAFWQQDGEGGIVAAASTLAGIFRSGKCET